MNGNTRGRRRSRSLLAAWTGLALTAASQAALARSPDPPDMLAQIVLPREACPGPAIPGSPTIPEVKALILEGRYEDASRVLECLIMTAENETDVRFLRGRIAEATGDLPAAIEEYRRILEKRPDLTRVRLELARLLFLTHEDAASRHHFELALGGDVPQAVRDNILRFLAALRQRQRIRAEFSVGIVPDSNINTATEQSEVDLFGLPFRLSEEATRKSGVGVSMEGSLELQQPLTERYGLEVGARLRRIEHSGADFDDMTAHAFAGLRRVYAGGDVGARAIVSHQWFGGRPASRAVGGELDAGRWMGSRLEARLFLGGEVRKYDEATFLDGYLVSVRGHARYSLSPDSLASATLGVAREETEDPGFANTQPFVGLRYFKALPVGINVAAGPLIGLRDFDEPIAAFGKTRRDIILRLETEIVLRRNIAFGFAPVFAYRYTFNRSNIALFEYRRHQFEIGFTKRF